MRATKISALIQLNSYPTQKKSKGTKLKVFSGREAKLTLLIFLILSPEGRVLASYDIYREVHATKGFRRRGKQNVDRQVKALFDQGWLETEGTRETKPHFISPLYKLSEKARAALELRIDLNQFLETAPKDQLKKVADDFRMFRYKFCNVAENSTEGTLTY